MDPCFQEFQKPGPHSNFLRTFSSINNIGSYDSEKSEILSVGMEFIWIPNLRDEKAVAESGFDSI